MTRNGRPAAAYIIFRRAFNFVDAHIRGTTATAQTITTKEVTGGGFTFSTTGMLASARGNRDAGADVNLFRATQKCMSSVAPNPAAATAHVPVSGATKASATQAGVGHHATSSRAVALRSLAHRSPANGPACSHSPSRRPAVRLRGP